MARIGIGDFGRQDVVAIIRDLQSRVKTLELKIGMQAVVFSTEATSVSNTTLAVMAWSVFARSGSSLAVDVTVSGVVEVQVTVDGVPIGTQTSTGAGTVTVSGFLPDGWAFGEQKRVELKARRTSGTGSVTVTVLGARHR